MPKKPSKNSENRESTAPRRDDQKTREQLLRELDEMRRRVSELEMLASECHPPDSKLWQREQCFRSLIENASDGIVIVSTEGRIWYRSPAYERILGYPLGEADDGIFAYVHPDDRENVDGVFGRLLERPNETVDTEVRLKHNDGSWRLIQASASNLIDDPAIVAIVVNFHDTTEQRRAEQLIWRAIERVQDRSGPDDPDQTTDDLLAEVAERRAMERSLRETAERFRALIENASDGIAIINPDGTVAYEGPSNQRILGYEPGEAPSATMFDRVHPDDQPRLAEDFVHLLRRPGGVVSRTYRGRHKDGSWHTLEVVGSNVIEDPRIRGIVTNFRDVTERQQAEEALRASEEKFRTIFESANDGIIYLDATGTIVDVNKKIEDMFRSPRSEILGKKFPEFEMLAPEDMAEMVERFGHATRTGETSGMVELTARLSDGSPLIVEASISPIRHDGSIQGVLVVVRDATERKHAEQALRESEERFRALVENAQDAITVLNGDGSLRYESPAAARMLGNEPGSTLGKTSFDLVHPDDASIVAESLSTLLAKPGESVQAELRARHRNRSWRTLEVIATNLLHYGPVSGIVINQRDITDRKVAQQALGEAEEKWGALVNNAPQSVLTIGPKGKILSINRTFPGYTVESVIGTSIYDYLPPKDRNRVRKLVRELFRDGRPQKFEGQVIKPDGENAWLDISVAPIMREGQVVEAIYLATDITERKQEEDELRRYANVLQDVNSELAQQGEIVSHDILLPMLAIRYYTHLLRNEAQDISGDDHARHLDMIDSAVTEGKELAQNLMEISRSIGEIGQAMGVSAEGSPVMLPSTAKYVNKVPGPSEQPALSAREEEVLGFVGRGLTNAQIAQRLMISEQTVRTHLRRAAEKLKLSGRQEVAEYAARNL